MELAAYEAIATWYRRDLTARRELLRLLLTMEGVDMSPIPMVPEEANLTLLEDEVDALTRLARPLWSFEANSYGVDQMIPFI